jgi:O-antigen/teichoic acid export membrane protein
MTSQKTVHRLLWNSIASYSNFAITFVSSFFLLPITLRYLDKEQYGLLQLVGSLVAYVALAGLGTGSALMRTVAKSRDTDKSVDLSPIISTAFFFYLGIGIAGFAVGISSLSIIPGIFHIPSDQRWLCQLLVIISFTGALITFPLSVFLGVLSGRERFDIINIIRGIQTLCMFVGSIIIFWSGGRVIALMVIQSALAIGAAILSVWYSYREVPTLKISFKLVRLSELRQILSFGIFAFCVQIAVQISYRTDTIVIGVFLPLSAIAIYNIGLRLSEIAREIPSQIGGLLPPIIARLDQEKQPEELQRLLLAATKWILLVALTVAIPLFVFAPAFIRIWLGSDFEQSALITRVLCVAGIFSIAQGPSATLLMYQGKHKLLAATSLVCSFANLALSVVLVRYLGILGVALGTAIPVVVADGLIVFPLACNLLRLPLRRLIGRSILPPVIPAVITVAILAGIFNKWNPEHLIYIIEAMIFGSTIYCLSFWTFFLSTNERHEFMLQIKQLISRSPIKPERQAGKNDAAVFSAASAEPMPMSGRPRE